MPFATIADLAAQVGADVSVRGWVMTTRSSGKIAFLVLRDGTGYLQAVFPKQELADAAWERFGTLTQETCVAVTGTVRADARAPGGVELTAVGRRRHGAERRLSDHPQGARHGVPLRASPPVAALAQAGRHRAGAQRGRARHRRLLLRARLRAGRHADPHRRDRREAGELFATDYFDLGKAYLAQTGQLYVEAAAAALGKVYCFGPTFRAEKSKTRRHLTEFWMCEPEVAFADSNDNMALQEALLVRARGAGARPLPRGAAGTGTRHGAARARRGAVSAHHLHRRDRQAATGRQRYPLGHRPRRRRRNGAGEAGRPAAVRDQLSQGGQGVLHEGEPRRSADSAEQRLPGARKGTARSSAGRSARTTTTGCWRGSVARGSIRRRTGGTSTCGSTAASCTRGSGWDWNAPWRGSAAFRTSARRSRSRARSIASIRSARGGAHSSAFASFQSASRASSPASRQDDARAPRASASIRPNRRRNLSFAAAERGVGLHPRLPRQVDHGEEQVADLLVDPVTDGPARPSACCHFFELLAHFAGRSGGVGPVEAHRGGALLHAPGCPEAAGGFAARCRAVPAYRPHRR